MTSSNSKVFRTAALVATLIHLAVATAAPPTDADCTSDVPFADPALCTSYYQCFNVDSTWMLVHLDCPSGGIWDDVNKACIAGTCEDPTTTVEPTTTTTTTTTAPPTTTTIITTTTTVPTPTADASKTTTGSTTTVGSTSSAGTTASTTVGTSSSTVASSSLPSTTSSSGANETTTTVPTMGPPTFVCTAVGFFAHPTDPTKYYQCVLIGAQFYYYVYTCPPSACFQQSAGTCVVGSCSSSNTTAAPPETTTVVTSPPVDIICNSQGQYPFPGSCTKYYSCFLLSDGFVYYVYECPPGSYFNAATGLCTTGPCPSTLPTTATTLTTAVTTTTASTTTLATSAAPDHPCTSEGYFADPADCLSYYRCVIINGQMYRYMFHCPAGSYWNNNLQGCIVGVCPTSTGVTTPPQATTTALVTSTSPPQQFSCQQAGTFPDPSNCSVYHKCILINGRIYLYTYSCAPNTRYDTTKQLCVVGSC